MEERKNYVPINLRALREEHGMTQKEVAEKLNLVDRTISYYESGRSKPSYECLQDYAELFGVPVGDLISENVNTKEYKKKLKQMKDRLSSSFSEMITNSTLWNEYKDNLQKEKEDAAANQKIQEEEFFEDIDWKKCITKEIEIQEAEELKEAGHLSEAEERFEKLLTEGETGAIFPLTELSTMLYQYQFDMCSDPFDLEGRANYLKFLEKISVYCAIAYSETKELIDEMFEYYGGKME